MRRLAVLLAAVLLAAAPLPAVAQSSAPSPEQAAQALLDERERALREGDRDAFLATVDPAAGDAFRAAQGRLFDGLRTVPLSKFELTVRTDEIPDLSTGLAAKYGVAPEDVYLPPVEGRYRLAGIDTVDALDGLFYTFVRRDGRWLVTADNDLKDLGLPSARNLWDFGPVERIVTPHFTVMFDAGDRDRAKAISEVAEDSYGRLADLGQPVPAQIAVILPHTIDQLRQMLQASFDLSSFVAFATSAIDRDNGWESTAPRVYAQDANLSRSPKSQQRITFHHELIHVAAFPLAGPFVPAWLHEGVADWMSTGEKGPDKVDGSDSLLPDDYEFTTEGQGAIIAAYDESTSAAAFLGRAKGRNAPMDLLVGAGRPRVAPGTSDYQVDQAMRSVYGKSLADFQRDWGGG